MRKSGLHERKNLINLVYLMFRFLGSTYRYRFVGEDTYRELNEKGQNMIYALTHGRVFPLLHYGKARPVITMVSPSRDGRLITGILDKFGVKVVRGSSSKRGAKALVDLVRQVQGGRQGLLTVDGPRGPVFDVKPGVVHLARITGVPIVPVSFSSRRAFVFHRSWDRHMLPMPFSTCYVGYGRPVYVPRDASPDQCEEYRKQVSDQLRQLTCRLDAEYGLPVFTKTY